jgi:hypothetical protein
MADGRSTGDLKDTLMGVAFFFVVVSMTFVAIALVRGSWVTDGIESFWLLIGMFMWAILYNFLRRVTWFKITFGIIQIVGGLWANMFQLTDFHKTTLIQGKVDRLFFICGGIALLSKGVKDIDEAITDQRKSDKEKLTSPSDGPSEFQS